MRKVSILFLLVVCVFSANAQKFYFGLSGEISIPQSNLVNDVPLFELDNNRLSLPFWGVNFGYNINETFSANLYFERGQSFYCIKGLISNKSVYSNSTLGIALRTSIYKFHKFNIYLENGFQVSYIQPVNDYGNIVYYDGSISGSYVYEEDELQTNFSYGLLTGLVLRYSFNSWFYMEAYANYFAGFNQTNVSDSYTRTDGVITETAIITTNGSCFKLGLGVGVMFYQFFIC